MDLIGGQGSGHGTRDDVTARLQDEISRMAREIDEIKATVVRHDRRQVLVDSFHEELDQLTTHITGVLLEVPSKEAIVDIAHAVIQGYDLSQIESNQKRDEAVRVINEAFEKVKSETACETSVGPAQEGTDHA